MKRQNASSGDTGASAPVFGVVFYENSATRAHSITCAELFARQAGLKIRPVFQWHPFEALRSASKSEAVLSLASAVELVVFAIEPAGDLPEVIKRWTGSWVTRRGLREGFLMGLVLKQGAQPTSEVSLKEIFLRHLAHQVGMDYLSHFPHQILKVYPDSLDSYNQRVGRVSPALHEILNHPFAPRFPPI